MDCLSAGPTKEQRTLHANAATKPPDRHAYAKQKSKKINLKICK
jgi:hypothetical protein